LPVRIVTPLCVEYFPTLHIYFQPTSLFNMIVMLVLLVGGLGLIARD
jgi:hypothetical protein